MPCRRRAGDVYFEGNEAERAAGLVEHLRLGKKVAVISEAGMPGVSDPGAPRRRRGGRSRCARRGDSRSVGAARGTGGSGLPSDRSRSSAFHRANKAHGRPCSARYAPRSRR